MASEILGNVTEKAKGLAGEKTGKMAQLAAVTKDVHDPKWRITSDFGVKQSNTDDWLSVATDDQQGPSLLEDQFAREKIHRFDHERIPERVVHARGSGAFGKFTLFESAEDVTSAGVLTDTSRETPVFLRFSTVLGSRGSADTVRDVRGFAVKFYTEEGNWDIVGNNIPVFFIQDSMKFPDVIHAAKPEPDCEVPQAQSAHNNFWDFQYMHPEATHMFFWAMSDRAIPRSFRFMEGFGVHTFRLVNAEGKSTFVKFHWKPKLGMQSVVWNEAVKINGADPDFHRRDLWEAVESGNFPEWELGLQLFDEAYARKFTEQYGFDVLDSTKIIPEEEIPVRRVGRLVLNRMPDNFFHDTEQVAFCTQNIVPGIDFTEDPLLQGRNFSYLDTQLKRLGGPNFTQLPINAAKCPVLNFNQDGHMNFRNPRGRVNYEPNSHDIKISGPRETPHGFHSYTHVYEGPKLRGRSETFSDHYSQARLFYISQTEMEQGHIRDAFVFELSRVENPNIRTRMVSHLLNIDDDLAVAVAQGLGLPEMPKAAIAARQTRRDLAPSPALSILRNGPTTLMGRKFGVFLSEGADASVLNALKAAAGKSNIVAVVSGVVGGVKLSDGSVVHPDFNIEGGPSVLFDAVLVLFSAEHSALLEKRPRARDFVCDAFAHFKYIGYNRAAEPLLLKSGLELDDGCIPVNSAADVPAFMTACGHLRHWKRELGMEGKEARVAQLPPPAQTHPTSMAAQVGGKLAAAGALVKEKLSQAAGVVTHSAPAEKLAHAATAAKEKAEAGIAQVTGASSDSKDSEVHLHGPGPTPPDSTPVLPGPAAAVTTDAPIEISPTATTATSPTATGISPTATTGTSPTATTTTSPTATATTSSTTTSATAGKKGRKGSKGSK